MTTTPSAPPAMDRATLDWVLAEIRTQMAICLAAGQSRRREGSELGRIICDDRANELQRFYDRILSAYDGEMES